MGISLLVLTDFYQPADRALRYANQLAQAIQARLVLLHIDRDALLDPQQFSGGPAELTDEATSMAFESLVRGLLVPAEAEVGHGRIGPAVAEAFKRHEPALVVLGRSPAADIPDELITTTALDLLRAAPLPLLIVPPEASISALPRRVLLAVDAENFTLGDYAGVVRHLFTALRAQLTVLHVSPGAPDATAAAVLKTVERTGLTIELPAPVSRSLTYLDPAQGILQAAATGDFDLVVLVTRAHSFLGQLFHRSVTAQILIHSPLPVLVLPAAIA